MINVFLLGDELSVGNFKIHPITLPEAPIIGDRFRVTDFTYDGTAQSLGKYLQGSNLSDVAEVNSKVWGTYEGKPVLYVFLEFFKLEENGERPDYFFF